MERDLRERESLVSIQIGKFWGAFKKKPPWDFHVIDLDGAWTFVFLKSSPGDSKVHLI